MCKLLRASEFPFVFQVSRNCFPLKKCMTSLVQILCQSQTVISSMLVLKVEEDHRLVKPSNRLNWLNKQTKHRLYIFGTGVWKEYHMKRVLLYCISARLWYLLDLCAAPLCLWPNLFKFCEHSFYSHCNSMLCAEFASESYNDGVEVH